MGQRGVSLLELAVTMGIFALVIMGGSTVLLNSSGYQQKVNENIWLNVRREEIKSFLKNDGQWPGIIATNAGMGCFTIACPNLGGPQPFTLVLNPGDTPLVDGTPGLGMNRQGDFCTTFDPVDGDRDCIFGLSMKWEALCLTAACNNPQPKVTVRFSRKEPGKALDPMTGQEIVAFRDAKLDSINEVCTAMGGTLTSTGVNPPTFSCSLPGLSSCDVSADSYTLGFNASGVPQCGMPPLGRCGLGVLYGFNADGSIQCDPNPCPP